MIIIEDVIKGHLYNFLNVNKEIQEARKEQCMNCPLLSNNSCNKAIAIRTKNQEFVEFKVTNTQQLTNQVQLKNNSTTGFFNGEEYTSGCGCNLDAKRTLMTHTCPINLWKLVDKEYLETTVNDNELLEYMELGVVRFADKYKRDIKWKQ